MSTGKSLGYRKRSLYPISERKRGKLLFDGRWLWDFGSNDYLGLSGEKEIKDAVSLFLKEGDIGSIASRLLSGNRNYYRDIEKLWADYRGMYDCLFFSSGYQLNVSLLSSLIDTSSSDFVLADRLVHASIVDGIRLARVGFRRFAHNDIFSLESLLKKIRHKYNNVWIITESLFSMDGDFAPLPEIVEIARKYDCKIYLDEAHSVGVWENEFVRQADVLVGTFGKALGLWGAYVCADEEIINSVINKCRGFIFSTAPSPILFVGVEKALSLLNGTVLSNRIEDYKRNIENFYDLISEFYHVESRSQIFPFIVGEDKAALKASSFLKDAGFFAPAIRPPTVAEGKSRIRFSITAYHGKDVLEELVGYLRRLSV